MTRRWTAAELAPVAAVLFAHQRPFTQSVDLAGQLLDACAVEEERREAAATKEERAAEVKALKVEALSMSPDALRDSVRYIQGLLRRGDDYRAGTRLDAHRDELARRGEPEVTP